MKLRFDWDEDKNKYNQKEHLVSFEKAQNAFNDPHRFLVYDEKHSVSEKRRYCIGKVGGRVVAVRFTMRDNTIRIIGAGYWRKWRKEYERRDNN